MMITYGIGTISGPIMVGPAMDRFGPGALFVFLALYFALYGAYAAWRIGRRAQAVGLVEKTEFQANTVPTPGTAAATMAQTIRAADSAADGSA